MLSDEGGKADNYIIDILLDFIKQHGKILMMAENIRMRYIGIKEDTITGKRECFYIERVL